MIILLAAALLSLTPAEAGAQKSYELAQNNAPRDSFTRGDARDGRNQGDLVPMQHVLATVRQRYPNARIDDARPMDGSPPRYLVRITVDGRRIDVIVDARTGRILYER